ncbi:MAG: hypothetical protein SNH01_07575 [Rikenellaceae bacterium]
MKSIRNIISALALASAVMTSCTELSEDNTVYPNSGDESVESGSATLTLSSGGGSTMTKVAYNYDGTMISLAWEYGDTISLFDSEGEYLADFKTSLSYAGLTTAQFTCLDDEFQLVDGEKYQVYYPAMTEIPSVYTIEESTQLTSGDASHLKDGVVLKTSEPFTYSEEETQIVELACQQSVISLTLINIPSEITPKSVSFTHSAVSDSAAVVNLESHNNGDSSVTMFIPVVSGGAIGDEVKFVVTYTENGVTDTIEETTTLSQILEAAKMYSYAMNMDEDLSLEIETPTVNSASDYIILPLNSIVDSVGEVSDYSVTVVNGSNTISSVACTNVEMLSGGTSLKLSLSGKVYSDDDVTIGYNYGSGSQLKSKNGSAVSDFSTTVSPSPVNLVVSTAQSMYDFELDDTELAKSCSNNSLAVFAPSDDQASSGSRSLKYSKVEDEQTTAAALLYYLGSKTISSIMPLVSVEPATDYVARLDIFIEDMGDIDLYIRYKGYSVGTTTVVAGDESFKADLSGLNTNEWSKDVDVAFNITNANYTTTSDGYLSLKIYVGDTSAFTVAPEGSFYVDNVRFYKKSDLFRPLTETDGGVNLGGMTDKGEF